MATVKDLGIAVAEKAGQALHVMSASGILDVPMDTVLRYMSRAEIGFYSTMKKHIVVINIIYIIYCFVYSRGNANVLESIQASCAMNWGQSHRLVTKP